MLSASAVAINKIRVSGRHGDPLLLRLRLDRVLSSMDLMPHGLPSTAIVWIKRLRDPRPGLLDLWSNSLASQFEWERAVRAHLADLIARAPRTFPERNADPDSECVIFLDEADVLASLARDWCRGEIGSRWWWRTLFKSATIDRREVLVTWRDSAEYVPAALERLKADEKIEFAQKLSEAEAEELLEVVVRRFALTDIAPVIRQSPVMKNEQAVVVEEDDVVVTPSREERIVAQQVSIAATAPWQKFVPELEQQRLSVVQERFLVVSLMLLRAPSTVRTRKFATEIAVWQRQMPALDQVQFRSVLNPVAPLPTEPVLRGSEPDVFFENKRIDAVAAVAPEEAVTTTIEKKTTIEKQREEIEVSVAEEVVRSVDAIDCVADIPEIETNFAGVFYLVNLGIYLGLYGDFTMPMEPGIELNIWDFVALVGRELIGDEIEKDPVWLLLADLAGREDELENMEPWLEELMPSVRQRLRAALGLDETIDPGPLLISHSGRVCVTETHVDVFLLLAELPIAIRFAGLDRDPGWVPAAGRFIAFHFQ